MAQLAVKGHAMSLVLVTGASGFIGAAVVRALLARGECVRVLMRPSSDRRNVEGLAVETRLGSLDEPDALAAAVEECRFLFHVAADYRLWVPDPEAMHRTNVEGTDRLMRTALGAGVERIVYTSSVAVIGLSDDGPSNEATPSRVEDMIGAYKRSKFLAEERVRALVAEKGLPAVIVNPSTPIGPRDVKPTPTGRMILEAATGRMPGFVDTGLNVVHVGDVAAGHLLALERGAIGERYILGGENMSLAEILAIVAEASGRKPPTVKLPIAPLIPVAFLAEAMAQVTGRQPFMTRDGLRMARHKMWFSPEKAKRALGYTPRPARDAIVEAVAWFRDAGYLG
jgi:dihydroflavonol-4-reductase